MEEKKQLDSIENNEHHENETEVLVKENNELQETIKKLEEKSKGLEQNIFYLKADIENIKKNTFKEIQLATQKSSIKIISLFLSVIDDYERSLEYAKPHKEIFEGLSMTYNAFLKVLKDLEIEEIPTDGEFNPELHEAISSMPASEEKKENSIGAVAQKGYLYKKQVIRPSKVIVVI